MLMNLPLSATSRGVRLSALFAAAANKDRSSCGRSRCEYRDRWRMARSLTSGLKLNATQGRVVRILDPDLVAGGRSRPKSAFRGLLARSELERWVRILSISRPKARA